MSKEKQCECCHEWWYDSDVKGNLCPNCYYYFKQLKQQLDKKDKMHLLDEQEFQHYCAYKLIEPEIKGCLDREREYKKQLTEKDNLIEFGREEIRKRNKRIDEIVERDKKLFDNKNKEIEKWHKLYKDRDNQFQSVRQRYHLLNRLQASYDKKDKLHLSEMQCLELIEINEKLQKNQTQLAIQELEKVKEKINKLPITDILDTDYGGFKKIYQTDAIRIIDQQIKELKGE